MRGNVRDILATEIRLGDALKTFVRVLARASPEGVFLWSAALLLLGTGVGKAVAASGYGEVLYSRDPVLWWLLYWQVLVVGAVMEATAALGALLMRNRGIRLWLISGMGTVLLVYRLIFWIVGGERPCGCLGYLSDVVGLSSGTSELIARLVLAYLLVGSYGFMLHGCMIGRSRRTPEAQNRGRARSPTGQA